MLTNYYPNFHFYWQSNNGLSGYVSGNDRMWEIGWWVKLGDSLYEVVSIGQLNGLPVFQLTYQGEIDDEIYE